MQWSRDQVRRWWVYSRLVDWAPVVVAVLGYGLVRAGVAAAVVYRDGWPTSALGCSGAISALGALGQAVAVAVLLPVDRQRRPVIAVTVALGGIGTALVDAAIWVAFGGAGQPAGYAWPLVIAGVLAMTALVLCRTGTSWLWNAAGLNLPRITRVLVRVGAVTAVVAAAAAAGALLVQQPAALDRFLQLIAIAGVASLATATPVAIVVQLEQRRMGREARLAAIYQRLSDAVDANDR